MLRDCLDHLRRHSQCAAAILQCDLRGGMLAHGPQEAQQLHNVSDRLDTLAELHPLVSDALITIAGSVRSTATVLEVLVATKIAPLAGLDPASA